MATTDRWRTLSPYLDEMLEIAGDEPRAAWLSSLRARNPTIASELADLLAEHCELDGGRFLEGTARRPGLTHAGEAIGAYTLVAPIGEGGMGTVWLAERGDGRFDRRVAVKFLKVALAGHGGERFTREGRILARLTHPHIAQLIDAGVSTSGRPYLVLEYVDGEPIDRYCDRLALDVDARLRLFLLVLDAVAHAHANLIVHRDIKPSNVFVRDDGSVKLLDFGIAKLLDDEGGSGMSTIQTGEGGGAMTPEYAAPEQMTGDPVTTATDVYALGVLLYVLLTGCHPAGDARRSAADLVKAVVDTEPKLVSEVVSGRIELDTAGAHASQRATTPDRLRRLLRGDLDTIVGKTLKKNPAERYATVTALADDLRRHLQHEPISARRDSLPYRAARFVRRHRAAVTTAVLTVAALSAGLLITNRERLIAERRFGELRQLSNKVFELDAAIRNLPGSTDARKRLVAASLEYLEGLAADVHGDADLAQELGDAYWRVAKIQGVPTDLNLGDFTSAERSLQKADGFIDSVLASRPRDRRAIYRSACIANDRMILAESERRRPDAMRYARRATERMDAVLAAGPATENERSTLASMYGNAALAHVNMHRYDDALRETRRMLEIARTLATDQYRVGSGLSLLASVLRFQGDLDGALQAIQEARAIAERGTYRDATARMIEMYGVLLKEGLIEGEDGGINLDRPTDAIATLQKAFDMTEAGARQDPKDAASRGRAGTAGRELGNVLRHSDPQRALAVYDVAIARLSEVSNVKARRDRAITLAESAYALRALHRDRDAGQRIDAALTLLKETRDLPGERIGPETPAFTVLRAQADHLDAMGDSRQALANYQTLLDQATQTGTDAQNDLRDAVALSRLYASLARIDAATGGSARAATLDARRLELWHHWQDALPGNAFVLRQLQP